MEAYSFPVQVSVGLLAKLGVLGKILSYALIKCGLFFLLFIAIIIYMVDMFTQLLFF